MDKTLIESHLKQQVGRVRYLYKKNHSIFPYKEATFFGFHWMFAFPIGSMNYNLDTENSDIDSYIVVAPYQELIVNGQTYPTREFNLKNEKVTLVDFRAFCSFLKKGNPNYLEMLFSKAHIVNSSYHDIYKNTLDQLIGNRQSIAWYNPAQYCKAMLGVFESDKSRFTKHPENTKILAQMMRTTITLEEYLKGSPYEKCLRDVFDSSLGHSIIKVKEGKIDSDVMQGMLFTFDSLIHSFDIPSYNDYFDKYNQLDADRINYLIYKMMYNIIRYKLK